MLRCGNSQFRLQKTDSPLKWNKASLTYKITVFPSRNLNDGRIYWAVLRGIFLAFYEWGRFIPLEFSQLKSDDPNWGDIELWFASGDHAARDEPFTGEVYGHTLYNDDLSMHDVQIHFNDSQRWAFSNDQWNFNDPSDAGDFIAAGLHEIGHALGLDHIEDPNSIMNPFLGKLRNLQSLDIAAIQSLYGAR